jgi:hypothetical protein
MSRFAFTREDPEYYIDAAEWDQAFPEVDDYPEESDIKLAGITVNKTSTFVLHKTHEDFSPFATVNS